MLLWCPPRETLYPCISIFRQGEYKCNQIYRVWSFYNAYYTICNNIRISLFVQWGLFFPVLPLSVSWGSGPAKHVDAQGLTYLILCNNILQLLGRFLHICEYMVLTKMLFFAYSFIFSMYKYHFDFLYKWCGPICLQSPTQWFLLFSNLNLQMWQGSDPNTYINTCIY